MSSRLNATRMTRRQWTALLGAAAPLTAGQVTTTSHVPPEGSPQPAPASAPPGEKLQKAYADVHGVSDRLASIQVPMDVEPAFSFKA